MKSPAHKYNELSWRQVLYGYSIGIFPMGDDTDGSISWFEASPRSILPIELKNDNLKIPRSLRQVINKDIFEIRFDTAFEEVIEGCSARPSTWINSLIKGAYKDLFKRGFAHSVEAWKSGSLAGGLYGVAYKGAFFGESMFFRETNASKVAVVKLYEILKNNKFILLDIQMMTSHLKTLGAIEISKRAYHEILERAMGVERKFKY